MKQPLDLAQRLLLVADNDIRAFEKLAEDENIADASVGFHAQQAEQEVSKLQSA